MNPQARLVEKPESVSEQPGSEAVIECRWTRRKQDRKISTKRVPSNSSFAEILEQFTDGNAFRITCLFPIYDRVGSK
jgi:hypothetical protein